VRPEKRCGSQAIKAYITDAAESCIRACGGSKYKPDAQWWAATYCCPQSDSNPQDINCLTRCCSNAPGISDNSWKTNPALACDWYCVLLHEDKHRQECANLAGQVPDPINECCAYLAQMNCLIRIAKSVCGGGELPSVVSTCLSRSSVGQDPPCNQRYGSATVGTPRSRVPFR